MGIVYALPQPFTCGSRGVGPARPLSRRSSSYSAYSWVPRRHFQQQPVNAVHSTCPATQALTESSVVTSRTSREYNVQAFDSRMRMVFLWSPTKCVEVRGTYQMLRYRAERCPLYTGHHIAGELLGENTNTLNLQMLKLQFLNRVVVTDEPINSKNHEYVHMIREGYHPCIQLRLHRSKTQAPNRCGNML